MGNVKFKLYVISKKYFSLSSNNAESYNFKIAQLVETP